MSANLGGRTVDEWLATHPNKEVGVAKPLNGVLYTCNRTQCNLGVQRIDHAGYESTSQLRAWGT